MKARLTVVGMDKTRLNIVYYTSLLYDSCSFKMQMKYTYQFIQILQHELFYV